MATLTRVAFVGALLSLTTCGAAVAQQIYPGHPPSSYTYDGGSVYYQPQQDYGYQQRQYQQQQYQIQQQQAYQRQLQQQQAQQRAAQRNHGYYYQQPYPAPYGRSLPTPQPNNSGPYIRPGYSYAE